MLALLAMLLCWMPAHLYSQRTAADTLVSPEVEQGELPPVVAQYESLPKTYNQYYTHTELAGGLAGLPANRMNLVVNPEPTPSWCAPHQAVKGTLFARLVLGLDDYKFGETDLTVPFTLKVWIRAHDANDSPFGPTYEANLELNSLRPEQICRFDVSNVLPNTAYFRVTSVVTYTFPTGVADIDDHGIGVEATTYTKLLNSLRFHFYYTEEVTQAAYQKDAVNPAIEDRNNPIVLEVDPVGTESSGDWVAVKPLGDPVTLSWDMPAGCGADEYPSYQIQILRLFNRDETRYPDDELSDEKSIKDTIDWRRALSFETGPLEKDGSGNQIREFTLTIAEGRGYYVWRVRPIGDMYPGGIANDRNWGEWSVAPADNNEVDIAGFGSAQATVAGSAMSSVMRDAFFFYAQFDETQGNPERNWAFSRVFTEGEEGTRLHEGMAFMTPLLRGRQSQAYMRSENKKLVSEMMYDLSGRAVLSTLSAPMDWNGFSYQSGFASYGVTDFDADATWKAPNVMTGTVDTYYSDANADKTVPTAKQYPYSRVRLYPDGRLAEIGGMGQTYRIGGGAESASRTARILYAGASEDELMAMFGDEAPAASSVQTIYRIDPNKVTSVQYVSKEGQTIATALVKATSNSLVDVNLPGEAVYDESSETKIEGSTTEGSDRLFATKVAIVASGETVDLRYTLNADMFEGCSDACETCRYKVILKIFDAEDPSNVHYNETLDLNDLIGELCPPGGGTSSIEVLTNGLANNLPDIPSFTNVGTYVVEFRIITDREVPLDPAGRTYAEVAAAEYNQELSDEIRTDLLATVDSYLNTDNPDGLYAWLNLFADGNTMNDPPEPLDVEAFPNVSEAEYYTVTSEDENSCWTITIPKMACAEEPECDADLIDFEAMLPAKWGASYDYVDEEGNATGRRFPNEAWKYFHYEGQNLPDDPSFDNGAGAFNAMVRHMADDGYSCNTMLLHWTAIVNSYGKLATLNSSGDPGDNLENVDKSINLIDEFLRRVGKEYAGVSQNAYGANGYIEYAYRYFQHTIARDGGGNLTGNCEKQLRDMEYATGLEYGDPNTWMADERDGEFEDSNDDPSDDKRWEMLYNCISGQGKKPRGVEDILADCHCDDVDENSTTAEKNACLLAARDKAEDRCRSICELRADGFRAEAIRMFHAAGQYIEGEEAPPESTIVSLLELECLVQAMIDECNGMCDITELKQDPGDVNLITGFGTPTELGNINKVLSWRLRSELYDGESCPALTHHHSIDEISGFTHDAVLRQLNGRLARLRAETGDIYSGEYNSDQLLDFFLDLVGPNPQLNWTDWNTTTPTLRTIGDDECAQDRQPYTFELAPHIRAEFAIVNEAWSGHTYLVFRTWCEKNGVEYVQDVGLTEGVWWEHCEVDACLVWEEVEAPEDTRDVEPMTCEQMLSRRLRSAIGKEVNGVIEQLTADYRANYAATCLDPKTIDDELTLTQTRSLYHFTLYYYDRAGNLVKTVPPAGVQLVPASTGGIRFRNTHPSHDLLSVYEYNSLGQLVSKASPDGGQVVFVHDDAGRLRMSQDAVQSVAGKFSYKRYDYLSRVIEVGQCDQPAYGDLDGDTDVDADDLRLAMLDAANDPDFPPAGSQRTYTRYTKPDPVIVPSFSGLYIDNSPQRYTLNLVAHVYTDDGVHTQYSYDPHGNVEWVMQDIPGLGANWARYEYDLISGDIQELHYNEGWQDGFKHAWNYDKDNRLVEVRTSRDGIIWESDARYDYYLHGPWRRVEYGEDSVQGRDFVFTLQGWLKGINHPSLDNAQYALDPGMDGNQTNSHPDVAYDAFGMMLEYYKGDFDRGFAPFSSTNGPGTAPKYHLHPTKNLYNGNISTWTSNHLLVNDAFNPIEHDGTLTGFQYEYDVLNRLLKADFKIYTGAMPPNSFGETTVPDQYNVSYTYDPNGNITSLTRFGLNGSMDQLTYEYYAGGARNRLRRVRDLVPAGSYAIDIDDQPNQPGTLSADPANDYYGYDAIGNLIEDKQEQTTIDWSIYGKVLLVTKPGGVSIAYTYDAMGNRVARTATDPSGVEKTYYVYDAQGKVLAIYEDDCAAAPPDGDGDGVEDAEDNCPEESQTTQQDSDNDGWGDACDICPNTWNPHQRTTDYDGDGVPDDCDNCPWISNPSQLTNPCGVVTNCINDQDCDGVADGLDNCLTKFNPNQEDADGDGIGDACDNCPNAWDAIAHDGDGDGVGDECDNCAELFNPGQHDADEDGIGNDCDECPYEEGSSCDGGACVRPVEWIVYGNGAEGRIGVVRPQGAGRLVGDVRGVELVVDPGPPVMGKIIGVPVTRVLDEKTYELKDHLGNARVVITDVKVPTDRAGSPGTAQTGQGPFKVRLRTVNNYDPFGMLQPGRYWNAMTLPEHRFGFNGKESDNGWNNRNGNGIGTGNIYDYGFRIYDPRLGRFLSVDPLTEGYPWYTPYQYAGNKPIRFIDLDGLEEAVSQMENSGQQSGKPEPKPDPNISEEKEVYMDSHPGSYFLTIKKAKHGTKVTVHGDRRIGERYGSFYSYYAQTQTKVFHSGNQYADEGWYSEEDFEYVNRDWVNGQVLPSLDVLDRILTVEDPPRDWHGWQVDDNGYLNGRSSVTWMGGGRGLKAARDVIRAGKAARALAQAVRQFKKVGSYTLYRGYKKVNGELRLYIGKARNGISNRYTIKEINEYQIQALRQLNGNIPNNGIALGVEQAIMELNGWPGKLVNAAKPILSNKINSTTNSILRTEGIKWLDANVKNWRQVLKFQ